MTYKQLIILMSCFILKQALVAQVVPPPATQAEVDAGANRFKYVTPYTFANSGLISTPTNGVTAATATNIANAAAAGKQQGSFILTNFIAMGITNIRSANTNIVVTTNNGVLVLTGSSSGGSSTNTGRFFYGFRLGAHTVTARSNALGWVTSTMSSNFTANAATTIVTNTVAGYYEISAGYGFYSVSNNVFAVKVTTNGVYADNLIAYEQYSGGTGAASIATNSVAVLGVVYLPANGYVSVYSDYTKNLTGEISYEAINEYLIIRPVDSPGGGDVTVNNYGSGSSNMVTAEIGRLNITNGISMTGPAGEASELQMFGTNSVAVVTRIAPSNSVPVTNVVGLVHKAYAAYIAVDCNREQDVHITNRIAGNVIVNWLNAAQGQTLKLRLHGAASGGTDYFVTNTFPTAWLVANQSSNTAPLAVQLPVSVLDGTGAELNIRNYRLFTGTTNIAGAIINTYTE